MKTGQCAQKGFTLVELAIVMTIIGLIIGGILKGQEMINTSRVTATIAQVQSYQAAVASFRDKYDGMPGDISTAAARIPGCTAQCNPSATLPVTTPATTGRTGDGIVGAANWGATGWPAQTSSASSLLNNVYGETALFWTHLLLSDFITGITSAALSFAPAEWGVTHPSAKVGGGFVVGYGDATTLPGAPTGSVGVTGLVVAIVTSPTSGTVATMSSTGNQPMLPTRAAQIDRKMDDGRALSGYVRAYGAASCFGTNNSYTESVSAQDCGLMFRIQ